ncbi:hypothetical protein FSP39_017252 [Pinctada imbricata]|uniref:Hexosyltransferase n=1 Tax=Pinctada imbricata TaxID=66713 RepID=A0AA88Y7X3_PINIB|nr:hypothetical protein FSP39_017252 [Pinctada imbricata]
MFVCLFFLLHCSSSSNSLGMRLRKEIKRILRKLLPCLFLMALFVLGFTLFKLQVEYDKKFLSFERHSMYSLEENMIEMSSKILEGGSVMVPTINDHPYQYVHNANNLCKKDKVNTLILIKSPAKNYRLRHVIRHTMMKDIYGKRYDDVQIAFLLGYSHRDRFIIGNEHEVFNDIIQEDFIDSHRNSTLKVIMGYNWVTQFCKNAEYVVIMDDDIIVNIEILNQYLFLVKSGKRKSIYTGKVFTNEAPDRRLGGEQSVTFSEYPFDLYPDFVDGSFILHNQECVRKFQSVFPFVKYFPIHDIYLGIVAHKLGISPVHNIFVKTDRDKHFKNDVKAMAERLSQDSDIYYDTYISMIKG